MERGTDVKNLTRTLKQTMIVAIAGAACAAAADPPQVTPITRPVQVPVFRPVPNDPVNQVLIAPADLVLERFDVKEMGGGKYHLSATLRNGMVGGKLGRAYPGGGRLVLTRATGSTHLPDPSSPFVVIPEEPVAVAMKAIPALEYGQTVEISAETQGKAVFTATVAPDLFRPDHPQKKLQESNPRNNSRTVSKLNPRKVAFSTNSLRLFLGSLLEKVEVRLDRDESYVRLPGLVERKWTMPEFTKDVTVGTFRYYVHDIRAESAELSIEEGALALNLKFETGAEEIKGFLSSIDSAAPDINAQPFEVRIALPLLYDAERQYFSYGEPKVTVNAKWAVNGLLDSVLELLNKDISPALNSKVEAGVKSVFNNAATKRQLEFQLNSQIRQQLLKGGRIVNATITADEVQMDIETGW